MNLMTPSSDPLRTLGLEPGATPAEIKRAYRKLAKAYHPDSAGERALPRFLAIQAAYERLTDGLAGSTRPARKPAEPRSTNEGAGPPPGRSWRADAERARATREAFRRRTNASGSRPPGAGAGPAAGPAASGPRASGPAGSSARANPGAGSTGPGSSARPGRGPGRRAKPKATIGSTSYDGTENEPFEPGWTGATWYGAGSGTYWTINPKEYADPRKHGPEYLARGRRSRGSDQAGGQPDTDAAAGGTPPASPKASPPHAAPANPGGGSRRRSADAPNGASPRTWTGASSGAAPGAAAGPSGAAETTRPSAAPATRPAAGATAEPTPAERSTRASAVDGAAGTSLARGSFDLTWIDPARVVRSWRGRILLAALAWFPIGLAIFGIHGQMTGCAQYLAVCTQPVAWSVWIPQLLVIGLLLLSPRLSWIGGSGSLGLLIVAVPIAGLLTSVSGGRPPSSETTALLVGAMAFGWVAGVAIALSGRIPLPPWRSRTMRR